MWLLPTAIAVVSSASAAPASVIVAVGGFKVELAVQGQSAFRLSVCKSPCTPAQIDSVMLDPKTEHAAATTTASSIKTSFGSLSLDLTGTLTLSDAAGKVLSQAGLNLTQTSATTGLSVGRSASAKLYGAGAGHTVGFALAKTESNPKVDNTELEVSRFWSTDGFATLGVTPLPSDPNDHKSFPAKWTAASDSVVFSIMGDHADVYLMPAHDAFAGIQTHWALTGKAAVPPRYAFGFMACRWGWELAAWARSRNT